MRVPTGGWWGVSECPFNEASEKPSLIRSFWGTDFMEKREQAIRFPNICGMVVSGREIKVRKTRSRMDTKASVEGAEAWGKQKGNRPDRRWGVRDRLGL